VDAPQKPSSSPALGDTLEGDLHDLIAHLRTEPRSPRGPGSPPVLPAFLFWAGLLICVLRGFSAQQDLWQLVCLKGLWNYPRIQLTRQAIYNRLARTPGTRLLELFNRITLVVRQRFEGLCDVPYAAFATEIFALDHSTLDAVLRKLKIIREVARGSVQLIPGQIATLFDIRRQLFFRVEFWEDAQRNEKHDVAHWLELIPAGSLLLFDLGFYAFRWFDTLTERGFFFVSRQRKKISFVLDHLIYHGPAGPVHLRESIGYLGAHRADRAAHPVRLIEVFTARGTFCYVTNVLDPTLLPAAHVVQLYRRRWDIETAFKLLKSQLNLFLIWSGHLNVVMHQVFASLIIAQVVLAFRNEIAQVAKAQLREVSLPLIIRWAPELARDGQDPVLTLARYGRNAGIIRPFRGKAYDLPRVKPEDYAVPIERPPPRKPRYAGKQGKPGSYTPPRVDRRARKQAWGVRQRTVRTR
jgi:Transposase DDE domain